MRGYFMKLYKWSLAWIGNPKILETHCYEIHVRESCIQREEPAQGGGICCRQQSQSNLSPLTPDKKLWNLMFVLMRFSLIFIKYFFTMSLYLPFWLVMYILSLYVFEISNLIWDIARSLWRDFNLETFKKCCGCARVHRDQRVKCDSLNVIFLTV